MNIHLIIYQLNIIQGASLCNFSYITLHREAPIIHVYRVCIIVPLNTDVHVYTIKYIDTTIFKEFSHHNYTYIHICSKQIAAVVNKAYHMIQENIWVHGSP